MAQLMPMPLTVSCFSKIQFGFNFPVPAYLGSPSDRRHVTAGIRCHYCGFLCVSLSPTLGRVWHDVVDWLVCLCVCVHAGRDIPLPSVMPSAHPT